MVFTWLASGPTVIASLLASQLSRVACNSQEQVTDKAVVDIGSSLACMQFALPHLALHAHYCPHYLRCAAKPHGRRSRPAQHVLDSR